MRCWCSIRFASSWLTPSRTVTRFSCVISSETFWLRIGRKAHVAVGEDADQLARHALAGAGRPRECRRCRDRFISASASDSVASGPMVSGLTTMPDSYFLTCRTWAAWPSGSKLRWMTPTPPACAIAIAIARFGDGVHRGGDDRDVERNRAGDVGADIGLGRQDIRETGLQQHVVERVGFADTLKSLPSPLPTPFGGHPPR